MEEVHLWRGSAEQRARRSQLRKSGQFAYFNRQLDHPDWHGPVPRFWWECGKSLAGSLVHDTPGRLLLYRCPS